MIGDWDYERTGVLEIGGAKWMQCRTRVVDLQRLRSERSFSQKSLGGCCHIASGTVAVAAPSGSVCGVNFVTARKQVL